LDTLFLTTTRLSEVAPRLGVSEMGPTRTPRSGSEAKRGRRVSAAQSGAKLYDSPKPAISPPLKVLGKDRRRALSLKNGLMQAGIVRTSAFVDIEFSAHTAAPVAHNEAAAGRLQ
jgi:hypothetical protein